MSMEQRKIGRPPSWVWDYFSIKETGIGMSVCDICGMERSYIISDNCRKDMKKHLSTEHTDIYKKIINKTAIHWESHFERVQCLTDSIDVDIKCKHCDKYNNILLRVTKGKTMKSHLKKEHNVTESDWNYLQDWRDNNTKDYYEVTQRFAESIKRTRSCKQCDDHQFQRSNLCIMLKHLIQVHNFIPDVPSDKLPKGLLELNYPVVVASSEHQQPSKSGRSDSSLQEPASKRSKISHNASSDEDE